MKKFIYLANFIFILFILNIPSVENVDRSNFKTCEQSSFCRRQRKYKPDRSPFEVDLNSMKIVKNGHLRFLLFSTLKSHIKFKLEIFTLEHNSLRVKINELNPIRKRYEVKYSLDGEPKLVNMNITKSDENNMEVNFGKTSKFLLNAKPFRLDLFTNNIFVMSVNSKNMFNFEYYRKKPESNTTATNNNNEDGMWEETFKTHHDSKPYGPSSIGVDVNFLNFENVYGIPEHADAFSLRSTHDSDPYRLFNVDIFEYDIQNPMALYGSVPYMLAHNSHATVGFFWLNAAEGWVDVNYNKLSVKFLATQSNTNNNEIPEVSTHWMFYSGIFDGFFFMGPTPRDIFKQYTVITGSSMWLDFFNPDIFQWYSQRYLLENYKGSTENLFLWNDMNEPSVFNGPEITFPKDIVHYGGWEDREVHNLYGMLQHMSTFQGLINRSNGHIRPFILTRSFFAGSQRTAAVWTGDNSAQWSHLKITIPMLLSLSVTGFGFIGADVGGYFYNPDAKLLVRWYQTAAYQPFYREHAHIDTSRREPWLFGDDNTRLIRQAIEQRYTYLPYWYTLFYKQERQGIPPMLPLWANFPKDKNTFKTEDSFMVGNGLLVYPVTEADINQISVYFPGENTVWYDIRTYTQYNGSETVLINVDIESIPVYQLGGVIIPRRLRKRRSSMLALQDPITLVVALDRNYEAKGELYMDDGYTYNYRGKRQLTYRRFTFKNNELRSKSLDTSAKFETAAWIERIIIHGYPENPNRVIIHSGDKQATPLHSYQEASHTLIIRRPGPLVTSDWTLSIS
ncbi:unnamed protein product [Rotaria sp. Silwood2]|nr:unnamed protein product [Rotaria sp. Silwood2]